MALVHIYDATLRSRHYCKTWYDATLRIRHYCKTWYDATLRSGVGWGGLITFNGTSTHIWCYATQSSLLQDMIWCYATHSSLLQDMIWCYATQWGGVGWGGLITFNGTSTHIWCYATQSSLLQDMIWCYAFATHSSLLQDMIWCYATKLRIRHYCKTWYDATANNVQWH